VDAVALASIVTTRSAVQPVRYVTGTVIPVDGGRFVPGQDPENR
jgi:hypothetical protein